MDIYWKRNVPLCQNMITLIGKVRDYYVESVTTSRKSTSLPNAEMGRGQQHASKVRAGSMNYEPSRDKSDYGITGMYDGTP